MEKLNSYVQFGYSEYRNKIKLAKLFLDVIRLFLDA